MSYHDLIRREGKKYGWGLILIRRKEFVDFLNILKSRFKGSRIRLLDVGAWKCGLFNWLREKGFDVDYVGIDILDNPDRVKDAKFYVMSPTYLLFPSGSFHAVVLLETLEHIIDYVQALREFYRVLVNGGGLFIQSVICYDRCALLDETHVHVLHPTTLARLLRHLGFKDIRKFEGSTFCVYGFKS